MGTRRLDTGYRHFDGSICVLLKCSFLNCAGTEVVQDPPQVFFREVNVSRRRAFFQYMYNQYDGEKSLNIIKCPFTSFYLSHLVILPEIATLGKCGEHAKGMHMLALGGHASVTDLLFERDSLAAALAAEQRRAGEFEKLWRRSEEEFAYHYYELEICEFKTKFPEPRGGLVQGLGSVC